MTPPDVAFSRVIIGSVVAFSLLGLAYFGLFGQRAKVAVFRSLPILIPTVGLASVGAAIAVDLPLVGKVLCWLLAAWSAFLCLLPLIASRHIRSASKAKPKA